MRSSIKTGLINYTVLGTAVVLACMLLFLADKSLRHFSDILNELPAFFIYVLPVFLICCLLYRRFARKNNSIESLCLSLLIGIPTGFILVMVILLSLHQLFL